MLNELFSVIAEWVNKGKKTGCFISGVVIVSRVLYEMVVRCTLYPLNVSDEVISGWNILALIAVAFLVISLIAVVSKKAQSAIEIRQYEKRKENRQEENTRAKLDYLHSQVTEKEVAVLQKFTVIRGRKLGVEQYTYLDPFDASVQSLEYRGIIHKRPVRDVMKRENQYELDEEVYRSLMNGLEEIKK